MVAEWFTLLYFNLYFMLHLSSLIVIIYPNIAAQKQHVEGHLDRTKTARKLADIIELVDLIRFNSLWLPVQYRSRYQ